MSSRKWEKVDVRSEKGWRGRRGGEKWGKKRGGGIEEIRWSR